MKSLEKIYNANMAWSLIFVFFLGQVELILASVEKLNQMKLILFFLWSGRINDD